MAVTEIQAQPQVELRFQTFQETLEATTEVKEFYPEYFEDRCNLQPLKEEGMRAPTPLTAVGAEHACSDSAPTRPAI